MYAIRSYYAYEAEGRKPHWRFVLDHRETAWDDLVRGHQAYHGARNNFV